MKFELFHTFSSFFEELCWFWTRKVLPGLVVSHVISSLSTIFKILLVITRPNHSYDRKPLFLGQFSIQTFQDKISTICSPKTKASNQKAADYRVTSWTLSIAFLTLWGSKAFNFLQLSLTRQSPHLTEWADNHRNRQPLELPQFVPQTSTVHRVSESVAKFALHHTKNLLKMPKRRTKIFVLKSLSCLLLSWGIPPRYFIADLRALSPLFRGSMRRKISGKPIQFSRLSLFFD